MLEDRRRLLARFGGLSKATGSGYHPDEPGHAGIKSELTEYSPKVRIELIVPDEAVDRIVGIIHEICHTGRPGDGVVWLTPVESFLRIRQRR